MSNKGTPTKKKKSGWFTKKEVTTPLLILNKLLNYQLYEKRSYKVDHPI